MYIQYIYIWFFVCVICMHSATIYIYIWYRYHSLWLKLKLLLVGFPSTSVWVCAVLVGFPSTSVFQQWQHQGVQSSYATSATWKSRLVKWKMVVLGARNATHFVNESRGLLEGDPSPRVLTKFPAPTWLTSTRTTSILWQRTWRLSSPHYAHGPQLVPWPPT